MHALSTTQLAERDALVNQLVQRYHALTAEVEALNESIAAHWEVVAAAQEAYNETVEAANQWRADVASTIEAYISDRSEQWQASPRGQAYAAWQRDYEADALTASALDRPDLVEVEVDEQTDLLDGCPTEVDA